MAYTYKVGAKGEAAVSGVLDFVQRRQARAEELEDEQRKFDQRLREIVLQRPDVSPDYIGALIAGKPATGITPLTPGYESPADLRARRGELLDTTRIRQEFENRPEVKEYQTISTNVRTMDALLREAQSTGQVNRVSLDQALITLYNKLTDPNSVVRESEYARTPENLPLVNRLSGAIQKITKGGAGLTDSDREALVWGAKVIANERGATYSKTLSDFSTLASQYGMEPSLITRGMAPHQPYAFRQEGAGPAAPAFRSEREALLSGLPSGTRVTINDRPAIIE